MFAIIIVFTTFLIVFLSHPFKITSGATINISGPNLDKITDFEQSYEVKVDLSINAADDTRYFLRGMFYKKDTNKYCGYTWNGQSWFNGPYSSGEGWKSLPGVLVSSNSASINLKAKLDSDDSDCNSGGEYAFKIQRYTQSGSSNVDDQNIQKINVEVQKASPTIKPTAYKTAAPAITNKPKSEPSKIVPSSTPVQNQLPSISKISPTVAILPSIFSPTIASIPDSSGPASDSSTVAGIMEKRKINLIYIPLFIGIVFIFASSFISFKRVSAKGRSQP